MSEEHFEPLEKKMVLRGKVAALLNERELVINLGEAQNVEVGMIFRVLAETPAEIYDPDTHDLLGVIDREKVKVKVTEVQPQISICRTYQKRTIPAGPFYGLGSYSSQITQLMSPPKEVIETLKIEDSSLPPQITEDQSYIKVGDRVIQYFTDE